MQQLSQFFRRAGLDQTILRLVLFTAFSILPLHIFIRNNYININVNYCSRIMEELKKHLHSYMTPESGLVGVVLSDREGVPLVRATGAECPDSVTRTGFLSSFAGTSQVILV